MSNNIVWPLTYNIIRGRALNHTFGMVRRYSNGKPKPHQGWDFEAAVGTTIYAVADGTVEYVKSNSGAYGSQICLGFDWNGQKLYAYYAHLSAMTVKAGDTVRQGKPIGATGKSGNAKGLPAREDHLHFEIRVKPYCGLGLGGRVSPLKVFGTCPLKEPAYQNLSRYLKLSAYDIRCMA